MCLGVCVAVLAFQPPASLPRLARARQLASCDRCGGPPLAADDRRFEPPPGLEPDATLLLFYYGMATVFREAAYRFQISGLPWKRLDQLGFDFPAMSQAFGGAAALASTWVLVALITGVLERERRYEFGWVALTWALAAPAAQSLKFVAHWNSGDGSFKTGDARRRDSNQGSRAHSPAPGTPAWLSLPLDFAHRRR